ncbi:aminoglycoside phosphotransferase family protein [Cryobacterium sp. SO2]|uniref:aminoglycoside phosphotransferase family protein n=1 Tax=Cryobacterium sp. SO2 TaxID=1897060 RepID=UPI00223CC7E8|nr:aminoglycoside phosphotransferase family protein [Cryobacterium sp. SO2]WEO77536.1 aminoglycoside phosphotransferase family protein [Cryobacterium sp. SO2]
MREASGEMRRRTAGWGVTPAGPPQFTPSSELLPGIRDGLPVMLKIARVDEEVRGAALLHWWGGRGAAPVLEREDRAILMVRATGPRDLTAMAASGQDAAATEILVRTARDLHNRPVPTVQDGVVLVPLRDWFRDLLAAAATDDALLQRAAALAEQLLTATTPADVTVLHGDIHHGNVLDFGDHWAAIDPKGLIGHRAFDFANILCNPSEECALDNLEERVAAISRQASLIPQVLANWTVAWCGLSLVWDQGVAVPSWHARTARSVAERLLAMHREP